MTGGWGCITISIGIVGKDKMMQVPQKCQYALRAIFELAKRYGEGPVKTVEIAEAQAIPARFLEVILSQLKRGGFVGSRRGSHGGYHLISAPAEVTVGQIIRFVEGPIGLVACVTDNGNNGCPLNGDCVFLPMWEKASKAMSDVYDGTTFEDLVEQERERAKGYVPSYAI